MLEIPSALSPWTSIVRGSNIRFFRPCSPRQLQLQHVNVNLLSPHERPSQKDSAADRPPCEHCVSDYEPMRCLRDWTRSGLQQRDSTSCLHGFSGSRRASLLWPNRRCDQCVAVDVNCTDTVEAGVHPPGTKDASAESTGGLPTDLHNAGAHSLDGENRSPTLCLSDAVVASTLTAVQRPVRFPTDRLDHCCNHSSTQHCYQPAFHRIIRYSHTTGLLESF